MSVNNAQDAYFSDDDGEVLVDGSDIGFESIHARKDDQAEADAEEKERKVAAEVDDGGFGQGIGLLIFFIGDVEKSGEGGQMIAFAVHVSLSARLRSVHV